MAAESGAVTHGAGRCSAWVGPCRRLRHNPTERRIILRRWAPPGGRVVVGVSLVVLYHGVAPGASELLGIWVGSALMPVETFPGKCREVMRPNASGGTVAREIRASRAHPAVEEHVAASHAERGVPHAAFSVTGHPQPELRDSTWAGWSERSGRPADAGPDRKRERLRAMVVDVRPQSELRDSTGCRTGARSRRRAGQCAVGSERHPQSAPTPDTPHPTP